MPHAIIRQTSFGNWEVFIQNSPGISPGYVTWFETQPEAYNVAYSINTALRDAYVLGCCAVEPVACSG